MSLGKKIHIPWYILSAQKLRYIHFKGQCYYFENAQNLIKLTLKM